MDHLKGNAPQIEIKSLISANLDLSRLLAAQLGAGALANLGAGLQLAARLRANEIAALQIAYTKALLSMPRMVDLIPYQPPTLKEPKFNKNLTKMLRAQFPPR